MRRVRNPLWQGLLLLCCACSFTGPERTDCVDTTGCQRAFGADFVCQAGFCNSVRDTACGTAPDCENIFGAGYLCLCQAASGGVCIQGPGVCDSETDVLCQGAGDPICQTMFGSGASCLSAGFCGSTP